MDNDLIEKLRRKQALRVLPDGREAVEITVQYMGEVPPLARAERRSWLRDHFAAMRERVRAGDLLLDSDSVSVSAQTVHGLVPIADFDKVNQELSDGRYRLDVDVIRQITDT